MAVVIDHVHSPRPDPHRRGGDAVVTALVESGVRLALGVPGGTIGPVFDALLDAPEIRVVITRHEAAAMFAAAGWGQATGVPAVVMVTSGPGVLNLVNALTAAWADSSPVLVLVGEVPVNRQGRRALQDGSAHGLDIVGAARRWCSWAASAPNATSMIPMVHEALRHSRRGPALLTLPVDLLSGLVPTTVALSAETSTLQLPDLGPMVSELEHAERPHLLIGAAARGAERPILRLAEHIGAPVATTPHARGLFPDSHPLALGVFGVGSHPSATRALTSKADGLIVLGSDLGELATAGFDEGLGAVGPMIQVHPRGDALARGYPVDWAVQSPVRPIAEALHARMSARTAWPRAGQLERHPHPRTGGPGMHSAKAVELIQSLLPVDTIFAVDSGEHTFFAMQYLHLDLPDSWFALLGTGSMGAGICGALGLALGAPERSVACLCGDGGLLMHLGELSTAAQIGLPIRWFVFHDGRLGMVVHGQNALFGRTHHFDYGPVDLASAARALGVAALHVRTLDEMAAHADTIRDPGGPLVVIMDVDPSLSMPKGGRLGSLGEAHSEVPT